MVVKAGEAGYSLTAFAGQIKVDRATLHRWMNEHEDFRKAANTAKALRALWWEERLMEVGRHGGGPGQAPVAMFGVKNSAPDDWKESSQIDHTSSDGSAAPSRIVLVSGKSEEHDE
jgi:transposase-like protein